MSGGAARFSCTASGGSANVNYVELHAQGRPDNGKETRFKCASTPVEHTDHPNSGDQGGISCPGSASSATPNSNELIRILLTTCPQLYESNLKGQQKLLEVSNLGQ